MNILSEDEDETHSTIAHEIMCQSSCFAASNSGLIVSGEEKKGGRAQMNLDPIEWIWF